MSEDDKQISIGDYDKIMSDRNIFNQIVYTPLSDALRLLDERQKDPVLMEKIEKLLNGNIPEPFKKIDKYAINGKQVATPNFDVRWFLDVVKDHKLIPMFYEYHEDKFTSNNFFKHSLGQLIVHDSKKGKDIEEKITIVDFNRYNGESLNKVKTLWGESLIDFHRKLFSIYNYKLEDFIFYDGSDWLNKNGGVAKKFYNKDLLLYVCYGILFENFLISGKDGNFTKNVFLPAFEEVLNITGLKPLIVPIPPMDKEVEECSHWYSYDKNIKSLIKL